MLYCRPGRRPPCSAPEAPGYLLAEKLDLLPWGCDCIRPRTTELPCPTQQGSQRPKGQGRGEGGPSCSPACHAYPRGGMPCQLHGNLASASPGAASNPRAGGWETGSCSGVSCSLRIMLGGTEEISRCSQPLEAFHIYFGYFQRAEQVPFLLSKQIQQDCFRISPCLGFLVFWPKSKRCAGL